MQGVPSVLIAKNQSWVRQQAQTLARRLPANVERADLIQVGLIAVAQAAVTFRWPQDRDSPEAHEEFVRYARMRVKGAMLDELRQMDFLSRSERRKLKAVEIVRERHRAASGEEPGLALLAQRTGLPEQEIGELLRADQLGRHQVQLDDNEQTSDEGVPLGRQVPCTPRDEVEARVDTAIVLRRLESFFAGLAERERLVIDAYLGVGLTPAELARSLNVTPSRVSQIYHAVVQRAASHCQVESEPVAAQASVAESLPRQRAMDHIAASGATLEQLIQERELALRQGQRAAWGELIEQVLQPAPEAAASREPGAPQPSDDSLIRVSASTRWG